MLVHHEATKVTKKYLVARRNRGPRFHLKFKTLRVLRAFMVILIQQCPLVEAEACSSSAPPIADSVRGYRGRNRREARCRQSRGIVRRSGSMSAIHP